MRLDVENNRTPLNEFIESLGSLSEPVELVRRGEVVATVATHERCDETQAKLRVASEYSVDDARMGANA